MLFKIREEKKNRNYEILDRLKNIGIEIEKDELENFETKVPGRPYCKPNEIKRIRKFVK